MNAPRPALRQRLNLSRAALAYPRWTIGLWMLISLSGLLAAWRLPVALFPDIVFPVIVVAIDAPGQPAEALEGNVVRRIEALLQPLRDRGALTSSTTAGHAVVTVPFNVGLSLDAAAAHVRGALAGAPMPGGARLSVRQIDLNESPIVTYAIRPPGAMQTAAGIGPRIERLAARLASVPGVARVIPTGLAAAPQGVPAPRVTLDGESAVALEIVKRADANTLEVARAIERVIRDGGRREELRIAVVRAEAPFIEEATGATLEALWLAALFSVLVIHPFLRSAAATAISGLAIPTSLVGTFLVMALAGFKFETITLLALALVIGIIVDDAIVDVENIVRHLGPGMDVATAVRRATDEIGLTVTAATLTIVSVFIPVGLMGGVVGNFFRPFGLTISAAVLTSLLVARTLTPVLAVRWLRPATDRAPAAAWERFTAAYCRLLAAALRRPRTVLAAAALSLTVGVALIPLIPQGFIPALDRGAFDVHFSPTPGVAPEASALVAQRLSRLISADPDVASVLAVAGADAEGPNGGVLYVALKRVRTASTQAVAARLRQALAGQVAGTHISIESLPIIAVAAQRPLEVILTGGEPAALAAGSQRVLQRIATWPGVVDGAVTGVGVAGDGTWQRHNGHAAALVRANLAGGATLGAISDRVRSELPRLLPSGVRLELGGESAQAADVLSHFATALGLAVAGVLVVLLLLFRSWQDPLSIAASLPLCIVGAMLGLFVARSDFGIVSLLGLVFLTGLVNKNAIILVDRINQLRRQGLERDAAILAAGPVRLRPIVMTTAAAVLGMLPIALGFGAGAELRAPMAVAIIGGLLTSTLLSLLVVPVIYQRLDHWRPRFQRLRVSRHAEAP